MLENDPFLLFFNQGQAGDDGIGLRKQPRASEDDDFSQVATNSTLMRIQ